MSNNERKEVHYLLQQTLRHPKLKKYFSVGLKVKNEEDILLENGKVIRQIVWFLCLMESQLLIIKLELLWLLMKNKSYLPQPHSKYGISGNFLRIGLYK